MRNSNHKRNQNTSLRKLTRDFVTVLYDYNSDVYSFKDIAQILKVPMRRIYDIVNVLEGANYLQFIKQKKSGLNHISPSFRLLIQPKQILYNILRSYKTHPQRPGTETCSQLLQNDNRHGTEAEVHSNYDSDPETTFSINSCPIQQPYQKQIYSVYSPKCFSTSSSDTVSNLEFVQNNQQVEHQQCSLQPPSLETQPYQSRDSRSRDTNLSDLYQNYIPEVQQSYSINSLHIHKNNTHKPNVFPLFQSLNCQPSVYNPYSVNVDNKHQPVQLSDPCVALNKSRGSLEEQRDDGSFNVPPRFEEMILSQNRSYGDNKVWSHPSDMENGLQIEQNNDIINNFYQQYIDHSYSDNNNYFQSNFNQDHAKLNESAEALQGRSSSLTSNQQHTRYCPIFSSQLYSGSYPKPIQFDDLKPFQKLQHIKSQKKLNYSPLTPRTLFLD